MSPLERLMREYADGGNIEALVQLSPQLQTARERLVYLRLKTQADIEESRSTRAKTLQIFLGQDAGCERCRPLNLSVVPFDTPVEQLIPDECERAQTGSRRLCAVAVSPWIKRPGQKPYIDR